MRAGHDPKIFGNVLQQSLEEIWQNNTIARYLDQVPATCKNCIYAYTCPGGSRALANKLGLPQDPLIIKAIRRPREKKIEIHQGSVPLLNKFAKIRDEDFGCIIYDFNTMYPVSASKTWAEELFNLKQPVEALRKHYGNEVLEFIAALSDAGLVEFN